MVSLLLIYARRPRGHKHPSPHGRGTEGEGSSHDGVVALCDTAGDIEERVNYDAYGSPIGTFTNPGAVGNRKGYAGYEYDAVLSSGGGETYHVRHRVYRSDLGIWTRRDPLGYVDGMNLYGYVMQSPVNAVDAMGHYSLSMKACPLPCDANAEQNAWPQFDEMARKILEGWLEWIGAEDTKCRDRLLCVIRAISWVESCHGTGIGNHPSRDPMQVGSPSDMFIRTIKGRHRGTPLHRRGPRRDVQWPDLPDRSDPDNRPPSYPGFDPKSIPDNGHQDPEFTPVHSYYWGIAWYFYSIQTGTGKPIYRIPDCDPELLLNGGVMYNGTGPGAGDSKYECKLKSALSQIDECRNQGFPE